MDHQDSNVQKPICDFGAVDVRSGVVVNAIESEFSIVYSFTFVHVVLSSRNDFGWFLLLFIIFWIIRFVSITLFLLVDYFAKKIHVIIDKINGVLINSP